MGWIFRWLVCACEEGRLCSKSGPLMEGLWRMDTGVTVTRTELKVF